jgi:ADP-ribose pyrophosphatase YjhB (NUDIX family)
MQKPYLDLLEELRAIAQLGLNYSKDPFDQERYKRLLQLSAEHYAAFTGLSTQAIRTRFAAELGYITPKIGVQGALVDAQGRLLLERRKDDSLWGLPSGWVEVNESPLSALVREFKEETNLHIRPTELIGLYTRLPGQYQQPHSSIHVLYRCELLGGNLQHSHESLEMSYLDPVTVSAWHKDHAQQAQDALRFHAELIRGVRRNKI